MTYTNIKIHFSCRTRISALRHWQTIFHPFPTIIHSLQPKRDAHIQGIAPSSKRTYFLYTFCVRTSIILVNFLHGTIPNNKRKINIFIETANNESKLNRAQIGILRNRKDDKIRSVVLQRFPPLFRCPSPRIRLVRIDCVVNVNFDPFIEWIGMIRSFWNHFIFCYHHYRYYKFDLEKLILGFFKYIII